MIAHRKSHGSDTALLSLTEQWKTESENHSIISLVSMALPKAFDTLPHDLKWKSLGLNGADDNTSELIKDYLTNLLQQVRLEDQFSNWQGIAAGIPQGSVLGPFIFNIFMNDHVHVIKHSSLSAYGDNKHVLYRYTYVCCLPW